jgi:hypothetical protein
LPQQGESRQQQDDSEQVKQPAAFAGQEAPGGNRRGELAERETRQQAVFFFVRSGHRSARGPEMKIH